jgi:hypothetical protein
MIGLSINMSNSAQDNQEILLLYEGNSSFLKHRNGTLVNEDEIRFNIIHNVPMLSHPLFTVSFGLVISSIMFLLSIFVVINAFHEFIGWLNNRHGNFSPLIGLGGIALGVFGTYVGYKLGQSMLLLPKYIFPAKSPEKIYQDLLKRGKIELGDILEINDNLIQYKYFNGNVIQGRYYLFNEVKLN